MRYEISYADIIRTTSLNVIANDLSAVRQFIYFPSKSSLFSKVLNTVLLYCL
jgi:hypothetical protein